MTKTRQMTKIESKIHKYQKDVSQPAGPLVNVYVVDSKAPSSQTEEGDFSGGAWAAMKAEMGLDERNPSCFLHSYSVVMVLRKVTCCDITSPLFSSKPKNEFPSSRVSLVVVYRRKCTVIGVRKFIYLFFFLRS